MNTEDARKLVTLLNRLHPKKPQPLDNDSILFWREVLKPWDYPTVREAAIRRARTNRFYPDPTELAQMLPQPPEPEEPEYINDPILQERVRMGQEAEQFAIADIGQELWDERKKLGDCTKEQAKWDREHGFDIIRYYYWAGLLPWCPENDAEYGRRPTA